MTLIHIFNFIIYYRLHLFFLRNIFRNIDYKNVSRLRRKIYNEQETTGVDCNTKGKCVQFHFRS